MNVLSRIVPGFLALAVAATACTPEVAPPSSAAAAVSPTSASAAAPPTETLATPSESARTSTPTSSSTPKTASTPATSGNATPTGTTTTGDASPPTATSASGGEPTPAASASPESTAIARRVLDQFMGARIERQTSAISGLMTARLQQAIESDQDLASDVQLMGVSNPCWYRYEVLDFRPLTETEIVASVRVYQHFWGGDDAGGLPRSWQQELHLTSVAGGWQIDQLSSATQEREEPGEPHGPQRSACNEGK